MGKLTIIIPVYNCAHCIGECLERIRKSDLISYEVIAVDDGSVDDSGKICDEFAGNFSQMRVIHQKNQGVSAARNTGLSHASGDYVLFVDADDMVEFNQLSGIIETMDSHPTIGMSVFSLSFDYYYKNACYRRDVLNPPLQGIQAAEVWGKHLYDLFTSNAISPIWNKMIRRSLLNDNSLLFKRDMFIYEDMEYSIRCFANCSEINFVNNTIYHYRLDEEKNNAGKRLKRVTNLSELVDKIENALVSLPDNDDMFITKQINAILSAIYVMSARDKISISSYNEIKSICDEYRKWFNMHEMEVDQGHRQYKEWMLNGRAFRLMIQREYIKFRHNLALQIKTRRR